MIQGQYLEIANLEGLDESELETAYRQAMAVAACCEAMLAARTLRAEGNIFRAQQEERCAEKELRRLRAWGIGY